MTTAGEVMDWDTDLTVLMDRLSPRFRRLEARRRARSYVAGLLAPVERKNGWQLAEAAGDRSPDSVQDFLARMRWDADAVRDDLRSYVVEHLGDAEAVLVLDETGFVKKGERPVGVQRQYSGTAGRIENCQIGVFLGYAGRHGHALIDRALYLPQSWASDAERRRIARVPEAVAFATKPKLGVAMVKRALDAGVPCAWVAADSVYGADSALRLALVERRIGYVLAVTSGQRLYPGTVRDWVKEVPADGWRRLSAGNGAKGPRLYDWAHRPFRGAPQGWGKVIRDQARADADRAQAVLDSPGHSAITPTMIQGFARRARERIRGAEGGYRRDHLRSLAQRVEVADDAIRIMGSKTELLRTLIAGQVRQSAAIGVPRGVPKWRMGCLPKRDFWVFASVRRCPVTH